MTIKKRLPRLYQIYPVYAIIVILVYGWTIYWALWKLPSWLKFLPLTGIGAIFCYLMVTNLIESLVALLGVVVVSFFLPQKWLREVFVSRGSVLAASVLISIMVFEYHFDKPADYYSKLPVLFKKAIILPSANRWGMSQLRVSFRVRSSV